MLRAAALLLTCVALASAATEEEILHRAEDRLAFSRSEVRAQVERLYDSLNHHMPPSATSTGLLREAYLKYQRCVEKRGEAKCTQRVHLRPALLGINREPEKGVEAACMTLEMVATADDAAEKSERVEVWTLCVEHAIPQVKKKDASSAAEEALRKEAEAVRM